MGIIAQTANKIYSQQKIQICVRHFLRMNASFKTDSCGIKSHIFSFDSVQQNM